MPVLICGITIKINSKNFSISEIVWIRIWGKGNEMKIDESYHANSVIFVYKSAKCKEFFVIFSIYFVVEKKIGMQ